ncbi:MULTISPECIES: cytosolic protein [Salimicrobium]|uniref:Cytosolic protein n=1 Tax=Salimicrobium humidisoli TaxID=2029857 RepID=A0ABX4HUD4_9BACI|nr:MULTISPECIES: cytosolic protein [Salimicrobium]PBB06725.1 cytosolic protein [Salimicrobium humidisoli]
MKNFMSKYFSDHAETRDHHPDSSLQTKYYKANKDEIFSIVEEMFQPPSIIKGSSRERGELTVEYRDGRKAFVVVTIIMVRPYRSAVDFSVTTESALPFDFGYSHNLVSRFYEKLEDKLPVVEKT